MTRPQGPSRVSYSDYPMSVFDEDPRVLAIRADKLVGHGSCTSVDECMDSKHLVKALAEEGITDPIAAVAWAREHERLYLERACDHRWGDDNDPELVILREFNAKCIGLRVQETFEKLQLMMIQLKRDDEAMHGIEDAIYREVLQHIAKGYPNASELAKEVLKIAELKFNRHRA